MSFDPSQQRAPSGVTVGGQWISAAAAKKAAAKKATTKKTASSASKTAAKTAAPKLGPARNAAAAKVQQDKQAQQLYQQAMGMDASQRAVYMKKLPPDQLEKLTEILYSSPTSDKNVVAARIAVANEMSRRGLDVKKFGALGGGSSPGGRGSAPVRRAAVAVKRVAPAKKAVAASAPAPAPRLPTTGFKNRAI